MSMGLLRRLVLKGLDQRQGRLEPSTLRIDSCNLILSRRVEDVGLNDYRYDSLGFQNVPTLKHAPMPSDYEGPYIHFGSGS